MPRPASPGDNGPADRRLDSWETADEESRREIMDDLIDDVGIDSKHSFEDKILPVEEAYSRWGDRCAILGGVDMDLLGRGTEETVRARTRQILDACGVNGTGYCLGSGKKSLQHPRDQ